MTDWELLEQYARDGSNAAMDELVRRHAGMVRAAALRELKDAAAADDVTQAVFLVLMRRAKALSRKTVIAGWLFRAALYASSDVRKQRKRRETHEQEAARMRTEQTGMPVDAGAAEVLNRALAKLSSSDRDTLILRYLEDQSVAEIAAGLRSTENAVRQRIFRALARLEVQMAQCGHAVSATALAGTLESLKAGHPTLELSATLGSMIRGAAPPEQIEHLVTEILKMATRAKIMAAAVMGAAAILLLTAGVVIAVIAAPQGGAPAGGGAAVVVQGTPAAPHSAATPAGAAAAELPPAGAATPKGAVAGAYRAALAGKTEEFQRFFGSAFADGSAVPLTEEERRNLVRVAQGMWTIDQLLQAAGEKFGAGMSGSLAKQMPMYTNPDDIEKGTEEMIDDTHAKVNTGNVGPREGIRVVKLNGRWMVDTEVLRQMNMGVLDRVEKQMQGIQQLTADLRQGKYATPEEFRKALATRMAPPPATTLP